MKASWCEGAYSKEDHKKAKWMKTAVAFIFDFICKTTFVKVRERGFYNRSKRWWKTGQEIQLKIASKGHILSMVYGRYIHDQMDVG